MARADRVELIKELESKRGSRLVTYICSDRQGMVANIAEDAVWPMYDCTRAVTSCKKVDKIDLYVYSRGGSVEVPWRIVSMLREHCEYLSLIVPYKAHSAATMIGLGCDEIVMGKKAELGPIDPAINIVDSGQGTQAQREIRVEDVMSYINFLRDKVELNDQSSLAGNVQILAGEVKPSILGSIYRTHTHIRQVAVKLLQSHANVLDESKIKQIVEELAEKIYLHGHAVSRVEAESLGLPVSIPDEATEELIWALLEQYADTMSLRVPIDVESLIGDQDEGSMDNQVIAITESEPMTWAFTGTYKARHIREAPANLNINMKFEIVLPDAIAAEGVPQEVLNQINQQLNQKVPGLVQEQVRKQSPIQRTEGKLAEARWRDTTSEGL